MNNKIIFIADFFADEIIGGGELNNEELISILQERNMRVEKIKSQSVTIDFLLQNENSNFIISNFIELHLDCREWITENANYCIYEHDHKYTISRNPAIYRNYKVPKRDLVNYHFYKNAKKVICQTDFHKEIACKNLDLDNIISIGGNIWSVQILEKLRQFSKKEKKTACSIMNSQTPHKNTNKAIQYCKSKSFEYELISDANYINFLDKMSNNKTFVFFPGTPETLSRVVCEARMMGMAVVTNDLVGAAKESWFDKKGPQLVDHMLEKRQKIADIVVESFDKKVTKSDKLISIISTFHEGGGFLQGFLDNIVEQTIFDQCELILVDSASQNKEREVVEKYMKKYNNIVYYRIDKLLKPTPCLNMAIKKANGKYITFAFLDDRKSKDCLETLYNAITNSEVSLVYGNVAQSKKANETFEENDLKILSEHSKPEFSRENMVKCLPGPMPLWRRAIHEQCGLFDEDNNNYADDWEMWLRAVSYGFVFKKVNKIVGLYLEGGRSQQKNNMDQRKEEAILFFKYSRLFGYNYNKYVPYFRQFLQG